MEAEPIYDTAARPPSFIEEFQALRRYRDLIIQLITRTIKTRYKRSWLGIAWTMMVPLMTMAVLTLVFSQVFQFSGRQYALYVLSGLLLWNFFAQSTTSAMGELVWSGGLMGRIFVPKAVFAVAAVGAGLVNLILALLGYLIIALALGSPIPWTILLVPVPILMTTLFALGVGLAVSTGAVYFQDVMPTYEVLLTAWMYLTPIIYPVSLLPEAVQTVLKFNPMYYLVISFRALLLEGEIPDPLTLIVGALVSIIVFILGWLIFTRRAREYAYYV
ncbi:MAG: ABC transporter permease [Anaerolineales bacterium]|jgi:ABC-type polysaccharide/polyol phosphate export permease